MITTTTVTMAAAYVGDQLTGLAYPSGNCPWCVGAVLGGGLNMAMQLFQYNGDWSVSVRRSHPPCASTNRCPRPLCSRGEAM